MKAVVVTQNSSCNSLVFVPDEILSNKVKMIEEDMAHSEHAP